jgi:serine/threonine protein kinase/Tol biopolymer transport system component
LDILPGVKFGAYEVLSALGAGGMGEVYRARDTTLGRDVALKILPEALARDPDRIARFRREAQILAALNHPLIASIYGVEDSKSAPVLVLELVEGSTLAERLTTGPLPLDEALPIAQQIAQALEAAHEQGIIHRDLKPSNIKLRPDGTVKVLDFGLARALDPASTLQESESAATVTSPAITRMGAILGTAAYMSPEQARGLTVDRGADIWAFGAVLFEMLTGARAFDGDDPTQTVASVLRADPDWSRLPPDTPESIRRVLRRCLEKDRRRRLGDMRDARLEIEDAQDGGADRTVNAAPGSRRRERLLWIATLALVSAVAVWTASRGAARQLPPPERRVELSTPPTSDPTSLAISPDGEKVVFVAFADGRSMLWVRMLESGSARPLRDTDGATFPFWSPDSRSIGFFASEKIRRIDLDGSGPKVLGPAVIGPGGTWNRDGVILFPMVPDSPVFRTSQSGGMPTPEPGFDPRKAQPGHRYPHFLPDGRHFLYFIPESRAVVLGTIDGPAQRELFNADAAAVFAPPSQVLFVREGVLYAQHFDQARLRVEGEPISLASGIAVHPFGGAAVSASATGSIAYRTGAGTQDRQLVWFNRSGGRVGVVGAPDSAGPSNPSLSPDGRRVVFSRTIEGNTDLWITDVERGIPRRLTGEPTPEICPVWLPDGASVLFSKVLSPSPRSASQGFALHLKPTATDGDATPLLGKGTPLSIAMDYSRDGRYVLYRSSTVKAQWDIWAAPMTGDRTPFPVLQSQFDERTAQFSPDAGWIVYESNESGQFEIYVRPFPGPGASARVSTAGGSQPRWRSGTELYYVAPDGSLMAVSVKLPQRGSEIALAAPVRLFKILATTTVQGGLLHEYDVSSDGQKFLVNTFVEQAAAPISLILNRKP